MRTSPVGSKFHAEEVAVENLFFFIVSVSGAAAVSEASIVSAQVSLITVEIGALNRGLSREL